MSYKYINHFRGEFVKEKLGQAGDWIVASLDQTIGWGEFDQIVEYEGHKLILLGWQGENALLPGIAVNKLDSDLVDRDIKLLIARFLSALNWVKAGSIRIECWTGGSFPVRACQSEDKIRYIDGYFRFDYLPQNLSKGARLALALLRDGDSLNHYHFPYSFLSYYKIINLVERKGNRQIKWIRENISRVGNEAKSRVAELESNDIEIGQYLWESGRCAVAHADVNDITVDPDNIVDVLRLRDDLPLIRSLAILVINDKFNVTSASAVNRSRTFELSGFRDVLGKGLVDKICDQDSVNRIEVERALPSHFSIRQWCDKRYNSFESMAVSVKVVISGKVEIHCSSHDGAFVLPIFLDFRENILSISLEQKVLNSEKRECLIRHQLSVFLFEKDLLSNGEIEIFDTLENQCLGRKLAYIPANTDIAKAST